MNWNSFDGTTTSVIGFESTESFRSYFESGNGINYRVFDIPLTLKTAEAGSEKGLSAFFRVWLPRETLQNNQQHNDFIKLIEKTRTTLPEKMYYKKLALKMPKFTVKTNLKLKTFLKDKNATSIFMKAFQYKN